MTDWTGTWRNEYGSTLRIDDDADDRLLGSFVTALGDSDFAGAEVPIVGLHAGACAHFAFVRRTGEIDAIASFTGLLRGGVLKTAWHVVTDSAVRSPEPGAAPRLMQVPWPHAVLANSDTFRRV